MFGCAQLKPHRTEQVQHDGLESEDMLIFMDKVDGGDLTLDNVPTNHSCIEAKNEQDPKSIFKSSRRLIQIPCKSRSNVDLVVCS
jgi:hypothetical protein